MRGEPRFDFNGCIFKSNKFELIKGLQPNAKGLINFDQSITLLSISSLVIASSTINLHFHL